MSVQCSHNVNFKKIDAIMQSYDYKKSNLIAILQKVQEEFRYLPEEAMTYIGTKIEGLSPATVYGVATFYAQFRLQPIGKYLVMLCQGTACHVNGSEMIAESVCEFLGVQDGETTEDGLFTINNVACLGCCSLAPVMMIKSADGDETYGNLTKDSVKQILTEIKERS